jgi:hypothetical protein
MSERGFSFWVLDQPLGAFLLPARSCLEPSEPSRLRVCELPMFYSNPTAPNHVCASSVRAPDNPPPYSHNHCPPPNTKPHTV